MFIKEGKPIFLKALNKAHHVFACFRKEFVVKEDIDDAVIQITARTFYRLYINDVLVMHGPARTAHGYLRVDEIDIKRYLNMGRNSIVVYVLSYSDDFNGYSNDATLEPGMLVSVIRINKRTALVTDKTWESLRMIHKIKAARISHCRAESEIYVIGGNAFEVNETEELKVCVEYLERGMLYPELKKISDARLVEVGSFYYDNNISVKPAFFEPFYKDHYDSLTERPDVDAKQFVSFPLKGNATYLSKNAYEIIPKDGENPFVLLDFGKSHVGFIAVELEVFTDDNEALCDIHHSEAYDINGDMAIHTSGSIRLHIKGNKVSFVSMEPYLLRYVKLCFKNVTKIRIKNVSVITYYYPDLGYGSFSCNDENLNRLYEAARDTLLLNTMDIFMDCPERERGGWLCDSLWTARSADLMLGDTKVEKAFIENFLLTKTENMWKGFFPEVYPGNKGNYKDMAGITTWSFWLMAELCEYVERTGDVDFANKYKERVDDFVKGSLSLKGNSGLLENMPHIFIDWSQSNANTQPISVSANALYSYMLIQLGNLYHNSDYEEEGYRIKRILQSALKGLTDPFLPDSLTYQNGAFKFGGNVSESNQYTSLWAELYLKNDIKDIAFAVTHTMGPAPTFPGNPNVGAAGLFIGLCIRLDLLSKWGEYDKLLQDMKAIFYPQLKEGPGTLWENRVIDTSSRCHGFASHAGVHLTRDILGLGIPDEKAKMIAVSPHPCGLRWARGAVLTDGGIATLMWRFDGYTFKLNCNVPKGYKVDLKLPRELEGYDKEIQICGDILSV